MATSAGAAAAWGHGFEGQRKADLGNGRSSIRSWPAIIRTRRSWRRRRLLHDVLVVRRVSGLVIWHSRDLVNWQPMVRRCSRTSARCGRRISSSTRAATTSTFPAIGAVSIELCDLGRRHSRAVERADRSEDRADRSGPRGRSRRQALPVPERRRSRAARDDGLSVAGEMKKVYDGWKYPADWIVEGFAQEGPKILRHGDYYYMVLAEGGTAGPPTGHMIVAARSQIDRGPVGELALQPDRAHANRATSGGGRRATARSSRTARASGGSSITRTRTASIRSAARRCSSRSSGLPTAGSDGWRRSGDADRQAGRRDRRPHGFPFSDDFSTQQDGRAVELLQRATQRSRSLSLRERRAGAEGEGHGARR